MEDRLTELPKGWVRTILGEILESVKGKKPVSLGNRNDLFTIPYINIEAFEKKVFTQYTNESRLPTCENSDTLIVWDGARCGLVGKGVSGVIGSTLTKLTCSEIDSSYLFNFLQTKYNDINKRPKGVGIPHVDPNIFWNINIPLPPFPEQHRIVAKIEELFTRLDAGIEALKKIKAQLKRYRQAVLKYAFEGKLTQEWREANKGKIEPASALLERIKEQRKKEAKEKFEELPPVDTSELPKLPENWEWATSAMFFYFITSGSRGWAKYYSSTGSIFIRMGNLNHDSIELDLRDIKRVQPPFGAEGTRTCVKANDILISITADVGMVGIVPANFPEAYINQHVALARALPSINVKYVAWFLASRGHGHKQLVKLQRGATKIGLGLDDIRSINIPFPSRSEQDQIVDEIEHHFSIAEEVEKVMEKSFKQSDRLRQSILKRAFEGKLVPQDPTDEPAEKLLDRIKEEKAKREADNRREKKHRNKKSNQLELI